MVAEALDKERRKNNIIVSGLPVPDSSSVCDQFMNLCEEFLGCRPVLVSNKCTAIDKPVPGKTPRLRIVFENEDTRNDVLSRSKDLRNASEDWVRVIYCNPDLTKAEAKVAYEERVRRRLKKTQLTTSRQPQATQTHLTENSTSPTSFQSG